MNLYIKLYDYQPVVIVDKGLDNFEARIIATLLTRGVSKEKVFELVKEYKRKYDK